jgi:hypothetical protein
MNVYSKGDWPPIDKISPKDHKKIMPKKKEPTKVATMNQHPPSTG